MNDRLPPTPPPHNQPWTHTHVLFSSSLYVCRLVCEFYHPQNVGCPNVRFFEKECAEMSVNVPPRYNSFC
jgi:hypothetical protein